jgi:hypothetical protein
MKFASYSCGQRVELPYSTMSGPLPALTLRKSSILRILDEVNTVCR